MMMLLVRKSTLALAFALFVLLISSSPAEAHALLLRSDPAGDARLFDPPGRATGWFSEPLEAGVSSLKVVDATGRRVDSGATEVDPDDATKMSVSLAEGLGPGFYLVTWETLSRIDGHFRFGSFQFAVLNPDGSLPPGAAFSGIGGGGGNGDGLDFERSLVKALSLLGQAGLVGALTFFLFVARPTAARRPDAASGSPLQAAERQLLTAAFVSLALLVIAAAASLAIQIIETPASAGLREVLSTSWGERWLQRQLVLLLTGALIIGYRASRARTLLLWEALAASVVYLALTSASSHGAAIERGSLWATAFDFVHLLAAAIWVGGLVQLGRVLLWSRRAVTDNGARSSLAAEALRRFSLLAATAVVPLLASGVLNAFIQVPRLASLVDTDYGLALTTKLIVVVLLLAVASVNAFVLRPGVVRDVSSGEPGDRLRSLLSRLVAVEASLGVAVLFATAVLTQLTTARALAQIAGDAAFTSSGDLSNPLISAGWTLLVAILLLALGVLGVLWTREMSGCLAWTVRSLSRVSVGIPLVVLAVLAANAVTPGQPDSETTNLVHDNTGETRRFQPNLSLLRQAGEGRFVSLQVEPFQVGNNTFRATVIDPASKPVSVVDSLVLRFSRLEQEGVAGEALASLDTASGSYFADFSLRETGWWAIEAVVDGEQPVSFYMRLDDPSRAPDSFAPPDYASDPSAEQLFKRALASYQSLSSVAWSEQLTSGSEKPSGYGVWFVTVGEAVANDQLHFRVLNQEGPKSDRYYVGSTECSQSEGGAFECSLGSFRPDAFELDYMQPTAFKLGRQEVVDGEMTQVVLMYNPNQQAWYAWWVGIDSGLLRRQAMVATGHFMLTRYQAHDAPITIELPAPARP